jgi:hypothetical protein
MLLWMALLEIILMWAVQVIHFLRFLINYRCMEKTQNQIEQSLFNFKILE